MGGLYNTSNFSEFIQSWWICSCYDEYFPKKKGNNFSATDECETFEIVIEIATRILKWNWFIKITVPSGDLGIKIDKLECNFINVIN